MNEVERERYSRQIVLAQIGETGQEALLSARALIIGMGGLGSSASMYLAAGGVGHLVISDFDRVEPSNLQRQIAHRHSQIGESKASSAKKTLLDINPSVDIRTLDWQLEGAELEVEVQAADVVLDCSDNYQTRFALNQACVAAKTPLVSGAAIRLEGQVLAYLPDRDDSPCYRCLYREPAAAAATCSEEGILAPLVGIIGSTQALLAMEIIIGFRDNLAGRLLLLDGVSMEWQTVQMPKDPTCPDCAAK